MTETRLRKKVVDGITAYNGATMGSTGHLQILKYFNDSKLCTRYRMTVNDAYCATTASAAYIKAGLAGSGKGKIFPCVECSCSAMITLAKKAGIWVERDNFIPKAADLVLYDWDDNGIGDNKGDPDHVGIVVGVTNGIIKVFEGNMGTGFCGYREIHIDGKYIRGFITPKFKSIATSTDKVALKSAGVLYKYAYKDVLGKSSPVIYKIPVGAKVDWIKDDGWGWSQVKYNSVKGWIFNSRLNMSGLSKFKTPTLATDVKKAIKIVDGKKSGTTALKKGTKYTLYCEIEHGEYKGKKYIGIGKKRYYI